jgi:hypothetical protein
MSRKSSAIIVQGALGTIMQAECRYATLITLLQRKQCLLAREQANGFSSLIGCDDLNQMQGNVSASVSEIFPQRIH